MYLLSLLRPGRRGDVAASVASDRLALCEQDGAAAQSPARLEAFEADDAPAFRCAQHGPIAKLAAYVGFVFRRHLAEPQVIERIAVIEFQPGDMSLLDAQRRQRLQPVGLHAERLRALK